MFGDGNLLQLMNHKTFAARQQILNGPAPGRGPVFAEHCLRTPKNWSFKLSMFSKDVASAARIATFPKCNEHLCFVQDQSSKLAFIWFAPPHWSYSGL